MNEFNLTTIEKSITTERINKFSKSVNEKNGIPLLLSFMYFNKDGKRFQLEVDFPHNILKGGKIQSGNNIMTEKEILTDTIKGLKSVLNGLEKHI